MLPSRPVVDEIDRQSREGAADIEKVSGRTGERRRARPHEDRDDDRHIRGMRRPEVRIVVEDDVAVVDVVAEMRRTPFTIFGIAPMNIGVESDSASTLPSRRRSRRRDPPTLG